jgi:DNA repair/transcription protein MET18/MMS19
MPTDNLSTFLSELVAWSDNSSSTVFQREAASHVIASNVNKHVDGNSLHLFHCNRADHFSSDVSGFLSSQLEGYSSSVLKNERIPVEARKNAISTWISVLAF